MISHIYDYLDEFTFRSRREVWFWRRPTNLRRDLNRHLVLEYPHARFDVVNVQLIWFKVCRRHLGNDISIVDDPPCQAFPFQGKISVELGPVLATNPRGPKCVPIIERDEARLGQFFPSCVDEELRKAERRV